MKNAIIAALGTLVILLFTLYTSAKEDLEQAQRHGRMLFNQLPANEQQRLREDWETRQDMLDPGDQPGQF